MNLKNDFTPVDLGIFLPYIIFSPKIDFLISSNSNVEGNENTTLGKYSNIVYGFNTGIGLVIKAQTMSLGFEMTRGVDFNMFSEEHYAEYHKSDYMVYSFKIGFGLN